MGFFARTIAMPGDFAPNLTPPVSPPPVSPVPAPRLRRAIDVGFSQVAADVHQVVTTVPGGYNMALVTAVKRAGLSLLVCKSEAGAALISAGMAWESKKPSLIVTITSPGVYGTMQALHTAFVNRLPLVLLSGETSIPGSIQSGDGVDGPSITRVTAPLCAWSADITRSELVPGALVRAVRIATTASRPVHLNIPVDVASAECGA